MILSGDQSVLLSVADKKMNAAWGELILKGVLCNWLVCLALWSSARIENEMARRARALIAQNLGFAMIYNVVTIPLALVGILTPAIAALLMSSSSLIVMLNALRLRMPK